MKWLRLLMALPSNSISAINGWKAVLGYVLLNVPMINDPMVKKAVTDAIADPSPQKLMMAGGNVLLLLGLIHKAMKEVKK